MLIRIDDFLCPFCSRGDCKNHQPEKIMIDEKTKLTFKAICACTNHSINSKFGDKRNEK